MDIVNLHLKKTLSPIKLWLLWKGLWTLEEWWWRRTNDQNWINLNSTIYLCWETNSKTMWSVLRQWSQSDWTVSEQRVNDEWVSWLRADALYGVSSGLTVFREGSGNQWKSSERDLRGLSVLRRGDWDDWPQNYLIIHDSSNNITTIIHQLIKLSWHNCKPL